MKYGIFADVHGNLEAFAAVLEALGAEGIEQYLCLGDIVGYGANPRECIQSLKELNAITVCGNHDWASAGLFDISYFSPHAKAAVLWTQQQLSAKDREFLKSLELVYRDKLFTLVHGTLNQPEEFHYIYDIYTASETLRLTNTNLCFVAHSHVPCAFFKEQSGKDGYILKSKIEISPQLVYVINVGSVGQPRDGDPRACFSIYDSDKKIVEIKRVNYDLKRTQDKIIEAGLPEILAYRLAEGR